MRVRTLGGLCITLERKARGQLAVNGCLVEHVYSVSAALFRPATTVLRTAHGPFFIATTDYQQALRECETWHEIEAGHQETNQPAADALE